MIPSIDIRALTVVGEQRVPTSKKEAYEAGLNQLQTDINQVLAAGHLSAATFSSRISAAGSSATTHPDFMVKPLLQAVAKAAIAEARRLYEAQNARSYQEQLAERAFQSEIYAGGPKLLPSGQPRQATPNPPAETTAQLPASPWVASVSSRRKDTLPGKLGAWIGQQLAHSPWVDPLLRRWRQAMPPVLERRERPILFIREVGQILADTTSPQHARASVRAQFHATPKGMLGPALDYLLVEHPELFTETANSPLAPPVSFWALDQALEKIPALDPYTEGVFVLAYQLFPETERSRALEVLLTRSVRLFVLCLAIERPFDGRRGSAAMGPISAEGFMLALARHHAEREGEALSTLADVYREMVLPRDRAAVVNEALTRGLFRSFRHLLTVHPETVTLPAFETALREPPLPGSERESAIISALRHLRRGDRREAERLIRARCGSRAEGILSEAKARRSV